MSALQRDLQEITAETVRMLSLVREQVQLARLALVERDAAAAERCVEQDAVVDGLQETLEQRILTAIARQQPVAGDLRFLGAVYRALADIERAGDYAVHVAESGRLLAREEPVGRYRDMERILELLDGMIEQTIAALADSDAGVARRALAMDNEIDQLYEQIQRQLLSYMIEDPQTINRATRLLSVARYLERLGDHIENVDEHLIFWLTGERL